MKNLMFFLCVFMGFQTPTFAQTHAVLLITPKELKNVVNDLKQVRDYLPRATFQPNIKVLQNYLDQKSSHQQLPFKIEGQLLESLIKFQNELVQLLAAVATTDLAAGILAKDFRIDQLWLNCVTGRVKDAHVLELAPEEAYQYVQACDELLNK